MQEILKGSVSRDDIKKFFDTAKTFIVADYLVDFNKMAYHICIDGKIMEKKKKKNQSLIEHIKESNKKFEAIENRIDKLEQKLDKKFEAIDKKFEAIDKKFEAIDKKFEAIDKKFEAIDKRFNILEEKLGQILHIIQSK